MARSLLIRRTAFRTPGSGRSGWGRSTGAGAIYGVSKVCSSVDMASEGCCLDYKHVLREQTKES